MLQSLVSNKLSIKKNEKYCVIIGSNASKTARFQNYGTLFLKI